MQTAVIDFYGVPLYCEFDYLAGSFDEPEEVKASRACAGAVDILSILNDEQADELEALCLEAYRDSRHALNT